MDAIDHDPDRRAPVLGGGLSRRTALGRLGGGLAAALALAAVPRTGRVAAQESTPAARPPFLEAWLAVWAEDPDRADALYAADAILEDVAAGTTYRGRDEVKGHVVEIAAGFPDRAYEVTGFAAGDRAAIEYTFSGTYTGTLPGLPLGGGQAVSVRGASVVELDGDKIRREAHYYDAYGFLIQLGVLPAPGAAATPAP